jgi:two-component system, sensor histidine kinase and response regulator
MQSQKRILVIEDDSGFRELLRLHLKLTGYAPEVAVDAVEGGRALMARPPDLVLCDVNMPFMSGFELLSLMRADERTASIPVIMLSGRKDDYAMARAMELGAADFLTKPVTLEDLTRSIQASLGRIGAKAVAAPGAAAQ